MSGKRQLVGRREDPHPVIGAWRVSRQHESGLGHVRPARELLHLRVAQAAAVEHDGHGVAAVRRSSEDVYLTELSLHGTECATGGSWCVSPGASAAGGGQQD